MEETSSKAPEYPEWMPLRVLDVIQPAVQQNVKRSRLFRSLPSVSLRTPRSRTSSITMGLAETMKDNTNSAWEYPALTSMPSEAPT